LTNVLNASSISFLSDTPGKDASICTCYSSISLGVNPIFGIVNIPPIYAFIAYKSIALTIFLKISRLVKKFDVSFELRTNSFSWSIANLPDYPQEPV
jgi:hypothetical protein